jgi:uncharacterized protein YpmB
MAGKRTVAAAAGAAFLAVAGIAIAAAPMHEHKEKQIALTEVPQAAMDGARTELTSINKAEVITTKEGQTLYELKGKTKAGKTVELMVAPDGKVLGPEK